MIYQLPPAFWDDFGLLGKGMEEDEFYYGYFAAKSDLYDLLKKHETPFEERIKITRRVNDERDA